MTSLRGFWGRSLKTKKNRKNFKKWENSPQTKEQLRPASYRYVLDEAKSSIHFYPWKYMPVLGTLKGTHLDIPWRLHKLYFV